MPVLAGQTYPATVKGACMTESMLGTVGILITFETDAGDISDTLWLTHKTKDRVGETLERLGADPKQLSSQSYLDNLGSVISGHECDIVTIDEEYKGKHRVRVQWISERRAPGSTGNELLGRAAHVFGGPKPKAPAPIPQKPEISDDDIPF